MEFIFVGIIWLVAGFINGLTGMGAAMVAVPLLSLFIDMQIVIPLACIMVPIVCALLAWRFRSHYEIKAILTLVFSSLPGSIVGTYILKYVPTIYLQIMMSIVLILYVIWMLTNKTKNTQPRENKTLALLCGFASGVTGASISFAGPPLAIYIIYAGWSTSKTLANISLGVMFISLITCITQAAAGLYTKELLPYVLVGIPTISLGLIASFPIIKYISQKTFKILLLVLIGVSGIVAGIQAISQIGIF